MSIVRRGVGLGLQALSSKVRAASQSRPSSARAKNQHSLVGPVLASVAVMSIACAPSVRALQLNFTTVNQVHSPQLEEGPAVGETLSSTQLEGSQLGANETSDSIGASSSFVRPQVAVQIYTTNVNASAPEGVDSAKMLASRAWPSTKGGRKRLAQTASASASSNQDHQQLEPIGAWQRGADEWASGKRRPLAPSPEASSALQDNLLTLASPLIDAVIKVPSSVAAAAWRRSPQADQPSGQKEEQEEEELGADQEPALGLASNVSTANVERAISHLIDSQTSGNVEFSMSMNGDEMVINPVSKRAAKMLALSLTQRGGGGGDAKQQQRLGRALRQGQQARFGPQLDSLDGEQSASEIENQIEGGAAQLEANHDSRAGDEDETELSGGGGGGGGGEETAASKSRSLSTTSGEQRAARAPLDGQSRNEPRARLARPKWAQVGEETDEQEQRAEGASLGQRDQSAPVDSSSWPSAEQERPRPSRSGRNGGKASGPPVRPRSGSNRLAPGSPRLGKFYHRTSDTGAPHAAALAQRDSQQQQHQQRLEASSGGRQASKGEPSVLLRGEDAKRFEQLLENLRSLSVVSFSSMGSQSRPSPSSKRRAQTMATRNPDESRSEGPKVDKRDSVAVAEQISSLESRLGDCERNNKRQLGQTTTSVSTSSGDDEDDDQRRAPSSNEASSQEPSSGGGASGSSPAEPEAELEAEAELSGDASDELNDTDGSSNVEKQEEFKLEADGARQAASGAQLAAPNARAVLVRKTIVQSFYDRPAAFRGPSGPGESAAGDSADARKSGQSDEPKSPPALGGDSETPAEPNSAPRGGRGSGVQQVAGWNSYIDYDKLDDRQVYRASESRRAAQEEEEEEKDERGAEERPVETKLRLESLRGALERIAKRAGRQVAGRL